LTFLATLPLLGIGVATGFLSGLLGVGGGFLIVPALLALAWQMPEAIGTSLLYVTVVGAVGAIHHGRKRNIDAKIVVWSALPAIAGAQAGAWLSERLPFWSLDLSFAILLLFAAGQLASSHLEPVTGTPSKGRIVGLGAMVGVLSGVLGVGGGVLLVPGQTRWLGIPLVRAIGNSLAIVILTGVSGVVAHVMRGHVVWQPGLVLIVGGILGLQVGLAVLHRITTGALKRLFVIFLALLAFYMSVKAFGAAPFHPLACRGVVTLRQASEPMRQYNAIRSRYGQVA
jgi:uncharacterized membrane protein YfcA